MDIFRRSQQLLPHLVKAAGTALFQFICNLHRLGIQEITLTDVLFILNFCYANRGVTGIIHFSKSIKAAHASMPYAIFEFFFGRQS